MRFIVFILIINSIAFRAELILIIATHFKVEVDGGAVAGHKDKVLRNIVHAQAKLLAYFAALDIVLALEKALASLYTALDYALFIEGQDN